MKNLNQLIIKFDYEQNFKDDDFYVSKSNQDIFNYLNLWPKWEKNFLNISGERFSGKSHLITIFLKKFSGIKLKANSLNESFLEDMKIHKNIILEDLDERVNEELFYTLINFIDQSDKYLITTSLKPIVDMNFELKDLNSRSKNFLLYNFKKPDDELMFAIILKNLSDRQISLDKKLINYIINRIERSYGKISEFIYKIDQISLKKKESIDFKIIKEALGE